MWQLDQANLSYFHNGTTLYVAKSTAYSTEFLLSLWRLKLLITGRLISTKQQMCPRGPRSLRHPHPTICALVHHHGARRFSARSSWSSDGRMAHRLSDFIMNSGEKTSRGVPSTGTALMRSGRIQEQRIQDCFTLTISLLIRHDPQSPTERCDFVHLCTEKADQMANECSLVLYVHCELMKC